ncbi:hypothetical protein MOO46_05765 [Apilactobacillus apisilvae]|uniref:Uncharacterized protein n=1 Tax=Apilactobacillus apisilvae TaxID=2923364 RepID=A0ABY4PGP8_9LACO|nr:hypothetical protein [Apilactobacillus apisilvae]UQS84752.1 hypothetical protein MOO46_05765 [Apilactobacillus apisilvae]
MTSTIELRNMLTLDYEIGPFISVYVSFDEITNKEEYFNLIKNIKTKFNNKYDENLWSKYERKLKKFNFEKDKHINNGSGFALFISVKAVHSFTLTQPINTKVILDDTMEILPLVKEIQSELHYRILILEKNNFKIYRIDNNKITEIKLVNKPISILINDDQKKFYQLVDEYLTKQFSDDDYVPTVLVANEENSNLYFEIAKQNKVLKNINYKTVGEKISEDHLDKVVKDINTQFYAEGIHNNHFNYKKAAANNTVSNDLNEIISDAIAGKIDTLFINEEKYNHTYNDLAITTIGFAGEVIVLSKEHMPVNADCAVINRKYV